MTGQIMQWSDEKKKERRIPKNGDVCYLCNGRGWTSFGKCDMCRGTGVIGEKNEIINT